MLTEEQLEIRTLARELAAGELRPGAEERERARELPAELFAQLAELGFLGMRAPADHGGLALDRPTYLLALEALAWGDASLALVLSAHCGPLTGVVARRGSEEQRARWLPSLAAGELLGSWAPVTSDPESDALHAPFRAAPAGEGARLSGSAGAVPTGGGPGLFLVFAAPEDAVGRFTAYLVPAQRDGVRVAEPDRTMGLAAARLAVLELSGVEVGGVDRMGEEGAGEAVAREALADARLGVAALALGIAEAAREHALGYARERRQFGVPLTSFGAIREKLAGMTLRIAQARALLVAAADLVDSEPGGAAERAGAALGLPASPEAAAALAKVAASEAATWTTDEAVQVFGGYGYMRDYPVERLMRDAAGTAVLEGTGDVLRSLVARASLGEAE